MTPEEKKLINLVLKHEGNYAKVDGDAGGETYMGISRKSFPQWAGWKTVDQYKPLKHNQHINDDNLDTMVRRLYYNKFYIPLHIDKIENKELAAHLLDHSVNAGIKNGVKILQKSINAATDSKLKIDGVLGDKTLDALANSNQEEVSEYFVANRNQYYKDLVKNKPTQKKFLNGWLKRVTDTTRSVQPSTVSLLWTTAQNKGWLTKIFEFIFDHFKNR